MSQQAQTILKREYQKNKGTKNNNFVFGKYIVQELGPSIQHSTEEFTGSFNMNKLTSFQDFP